MISYMDKHTRHRSIYNFATNLFAALIVYNLMPKKPSMNIEFLKRVNWLHNS